MSAFIHALLLPLLLLAGLSLGEKCTTGSQYCGSRLLEMRTYILPIPSTC